MQDKWLNLPYAERMVRGFCEEQCYKQRGSKVKKVHHYRCVVGQIEREYVSRMSTEAGKKGGKARALALSAERRTEIAVQAARTRWGSLPEEGK